MAATFDGPWSAVWPVRLRALAGGEQGIFYCPSRSRFIWG